MKVWIVEFRNTEWQPLGGNLGEVSRLETVVMIVASSRHRAISYCRRNCDADKHSRRRPWWWAIYSQDVDAEDVRDEQLFYLDWNGNRIDYQPHCGYKRGRKAGRGRQP